MNSFNSFKNNLVLKKRSVVIPPFGGYTSIAKYTPSEITLSAPCLAVIDSTNTVFFNNTGTGFLCKINTTTNIGYNYASGITANTVGLSIDKNGFLYPISYAAGSGSLYKVANSLANTGNSIGTVFLTTQARGDCVAIDNSGNIFIGNYSTGNNGFVYYYPGGTGSGTLIAGNIGGVLYSAAVSGSTAANNIRHDTVTGLVINGGNLYVIVGGTVNSFIYYLSLAQIYANYASTPANIKITKYCGSGSSAVGIDTKSTIDVANGSLATTINQPYAITFDSSGNGYIPEWQGNRIRRVTPTLNMTTLVGPTVSSTAAKIASPASFFPLGICIDTTKNILYITNNNAANHALYKIT